MWKTIKQRPWYWAFIILLVLPGIPFVIGSIIIISYANWPCDVGPVKHQAIDPTVKNLTIITHGKSDNAQGWVAAMAQQFKPRQNEQIISVDWQQGADSLLRSSRNADVIGQRLAADVFAAAPLLKEVHFISHSAGAFMAYQFCKTLKKTAPSIKIKTTYLDPLSIYRAIYWDYGVHYFGRCADESEAYIHIGDGVPGSDVKLQHGKTIDITAAKPADFTNGHLWPVYYYMQLIEH